MGFHSSQAQEALQRHATFQEVVQALLDPEPAACSSESEENLDEEPPKAGSWTGCTPSQGVPFLDEEAGTCRQVLVSFLELPKLRRAG